MPQSKRRDQALLSFADFFDRRTNAAMHNTWHPAFVITGQLAQLGRDRVAQVLQIILVALKLILLGHRVHLEPGQRLRALVHRLLLVVVADLAVELKCCAETDNAGK